VCAALIPYRLALGGIILISIFFNFWQLGQNGFGNLYYAAAGPHRHRFLVGNVADPGVRPF
jgi:hypothetical protein